MDRNLCYRRRFVDVDRRQGDVRSWRYLLILADEPGGYQASDSIHQVQEAPKRRSPEGSIAPRADKRDDTVGCGRGCNNQSACFIRRLEYFLIIDQSADHCYAGKETSDPDRSGHRKEGASRNQNARPELYAARQFLDRDTQAKLDVRIPFDVYFQDPFVTASNAAYDFDEQFAVPWEPGLNDGPTSARFAVVDYDGGTETLNPPARWDADLDKFVDTKGKVLDRNNLDSPQFRQMNVWATLQNALDFFESGFGLGRRIAWGFEGNRLIVVPHAGYGENAFYDRESKSLQFYYFDRGEEGAQAHPHLPLGGHHQSRIRPRRARRHPPALPRIRLRRDRGLPRVPW